MNWAKKTLVTGAGGFIGSHLTEALVNLGAQVRAFVRYNSRNDRGHVDHLSADVRSALEIYVGDLKDPAAVRNAVKGVDCVFHLGALIAIPYSYVNPMDFVQTNIVGTANILNACLEHGVQRFIHTSTSEVYGTLHYAPIDEKHPIEGKSPYAASKIGAVVQVAGNTVVKRPKNSPSGTRRCVTHARVPSVFQAMPRGRRNADIVCRIARLATSTAKIWSDPDAVTSALVPVGLKHTPNVSKPAANESITVREAASRM